VGPRAGVDDVEKRKFLTLPGLELRPLGGPARSQSVLPDSLIFTEHIRTDSHPMYIHFFFICGTHEEFCFLRC
jgi:hypothetical protein